ncbi:cation diffusion facilitator family transporter [Dysosmobacter sp.]|uniref:cation diffusion facilitator family transporter n=1 Tax=Dysosmobacter sp. TaxID=2591382 RepID=UPI003AB8FF93
MISLLARFFCKSDGKSPAQLRTAYGILCGAVGIGLNLLLFLGKFFAGTLSGSVAITADAFNNLSDAGSSVVTLLGFRIAAKAPDPGHPFGHGRAEYLSGLAVSMLILLMGVELAKESLNKILHPALVEFSWLVIGILAASICVKLYMAMYNRSLGKKLSAPALLAAAADSLGDCMSTSAVLVATLIGHYFQLPVDGWVGVLVALLIFKGGIDAAKDTIDPLLGKPPTPEFVKEIEDLVMAHKEISGIHDLVVHDYGPGRVMISLHAEVPANEDVLALHDEIDNVEKELREKLGCDAVLHMDPVVTDDGVTEETRRRVQTLIHCIDDAIDIHDFRMVAGPTHTNLIFDAVVPFGFRLTDQEVEQKIRSAVRALDGNYYAVVNVERSYT